MCIYYPSTAGMIWVDHWVIWTAYYTTKIIQFNWITNSGLVRIFWCQCCTNTRWKKKIQIWWTANYKIPQFRYHNNIKCE